MAVLSCWNLTFGWHRSPHQCQDLWLLLAVWVMSHMGPHCPRLGELGAETCALPSSPLPRGGAHRWPLSGSVGVRGGDYSLLHS